MDFIISKLVLDPSVEQLQEILTISQLFLFGYSYGEFFNFLSMDFIILAFKISDTGFTVIVLRDKDFTAPLKEILKEFLINSNNKLIYFNYGYSLIPFFQKLSFNPSFLNIQHLDLSVLFSLLFNDMGVNDKTILLDKLNKWMVLVFDIELLPFPSSPNWTSQELLNRVVTYIKAIILLYMHIHNENYTWFNTFTGEPIGLLDYYIKYEQPLINLMIQLSITPVTLDVKTLNDLSLENKIIKQKLKEKFVKMFNLEWKDFIFTKPKEFEQALLPNTWELPKPFPRSNRIGIFDTLDGKKKKKLLALGFKRLKIFREKTKITNAKLNLVIEILEFFSNSKKLDDFLKIVKNQENLIKQENLIHLSNSKYVYVNYNLRGTRTGRIGTSKPNIQGFPHYLRKIIKPSSTNGFLKLDINQEELRIIAYIAQVPKWLNIYKNKLDIHAQTAAIISNKTSQLFNKLKPLDPSTFNYYRQIGKIINFGLCYGMTPKGLISHLDEAGVFFDF